MIIPIDLIRTRANNLGRSVHEVSPIKIDRSLRLSQCNEENLKQFFIDNLPPTINENESVDFLLNRFNRVVTEAMKENRTLTNVEPSPWGNAERWKRLLKDNDNKNIMEVNRVEC